MSTPTVGFIGLGNIGQPIAQRIAEAGFAMVVYDIADLSRRAPSATRCAKSVTEVAAVDILFLCLPSVQASASVVAEVVTAASLPKVLVEVSTIGPAAAHAAAVACSAHGVAYLDAPVSGGVARAREGKLATMIAGSEVAVAQARPALESYCDRIYRVGSEPGQGQAMKLVNNYASIACMISTSEAIAYGRTQGLPMTIMLDVINGSSGQSFVSRTLFPRHVANGAFDSGATPGIVGKDLALFVQAAHNAGAMCDIGEQTHEIFLRFAATASPYDDWLRIYEFIRNSRKA